jgi:hypothetical protein
MSTRTGHASPAPRHRLRHPGVLDHRRHPGVVVEPDRLDGRAAELGVQRREVVRAVNGDDPVLGLHSANPDCTVGQRIHDALAGVDRRAQAALAAELEQTTLGDLVRSTAGAVA